MATMPLLTQRRSPISHSPSAFPSPSAPAGGHNHSVSRSSSSGVSPRLPVFTRFPSISRPSSPSPLFTSADSKSSLRAQAAGARRFAFRPRSVLAVLLAICGAYVLLHPAHAHTRRRLASRLHPSALRATGYVSPNRPWFIYGTGVPRYEPYEEHPIRTLIREAEAKWEEKKARQSKSLKEAKREYRRRNGREPPRGFDEWYMWAKKNDVQLLDEYDSITAAVYPLLSLPVDEIHRRIDFLASPAAGPLGSSHAILTIKNGLRQGWTGGVWRETILSTWEQLLEGLEELLPDLRAPIHLHDGPMSIMDWEEMESYRAHARAGTYANETFEEATVITTTAWKARERSCAPTSRYRRVAQGLEQPGEPAGPPFIRDHLREMSYCDNPEFREIHGAQSLDGFILKLFPSFTMSRSSVNGDIGWPATIQYNLNPDRESPFLSKKGHNLLWRGSMDGIMITEDHKWRQSHRFRLVTLMNSADSSISRTVRVTKVDRFGREYQSDVETDLQALNKRYSNVRATGKDPHCEAHFCAEIDEEFKPYAKKAKLEEMAESRYVMDVDGNAYSARFRTHLMSNQVPLKATVYREWYAERIQPWVHYVPIRQDYADLYNVLAFFDGGLGSDREGHHDELAAKIAAEGKQWAEKHWRIVDMKAYVFRLLLEYGRIFEEIRTPAAQTDYVPI